MFEDVTKYFKTESGIQQSVFNSEKAADLFMKNLPKGLEEISAENAEEAIATARKASEAEAVDADKKAKAAMMAELKREIMAELKADEKAEAHADA